VDLLSSLGLLPDSRVEECQLNGKTAIANHANRLKETEFHAAVVVAVSCFSREQNRSLENFLETTGSTVDDSKDSLPN